MMKIRKPALMLHHQDGLRETIFCGEAIIVSLHSIPKCFWYRKGADYNGNP